MRGTFCAAVVAGFLAMFLCAPVFADQIKLKNGNVIEGEIINESADELALQIPGGLVYFKRSEISDVVKMPRVAKKISFVQIPAKKTPTKTQPYFSEIMKVWQSGILTHPNDQRSFSKNSLNAQQQDQIETVHYQAVLGVIRHAFDLQLFHTAMFCVLFGAVYGGLLTKIYMKLRKRPISYTKTFMFMFCIGLIDYVIMLLSFYIFPASIDTLVGPYAAMSATIYTLCKIAGFIFGALILFRMSARTLSLGFFDTVGLAAFTLFFTCLLFFAAGLLGAIPGTGISGMFSS